jgi:hypothetical protein
MQNSIRTGELIFTLTRAELRSCVKPRTVLGFIHNRVFRTDVFYPSGKRGWRAQRAGSFAFLAAK